MADDLATIGYKADLTGINQINRGLDSVGKASKKTEGAMNESAKSIKSNLLSVGAAIGGMVSASAGASKLISVARETDRLMAGLTTMTGGVNEAAMAFSELEKFASTTPYALDQSVTAFTKLVALGLTPSQKAMQSYGNTASAMGKDLNQMIEAVADATTFEFERLKEFGIKTKQQGDQVSFTFQGVTTTVRKSASEIESYLMRIGENNFAGAMANRMATLDGALSNLSDSWDALFRAVVTQGTGNAIAEQVQIAISWLNSLTESISSGQTAGYIKALGQQFKSTFDDISFFLDALDKQVIQTLSGWISSSGVASTSMSDAFMQFPTNMRAMIQIATVEVAAFVDRMIAYGAAIPDAFNPFVSEDEYTSSLNARLKSIDMAKKATVSQYLEERDAAIESATAQIEASDNLREEFKKRSAERVDLSQFKIGGASTVQISDAEAKAIKIATDEREKWILATIAAADPARALRAEMAKVNEAMMTGAISSDIGTKRLQQLQDEMDALSKTIGNPFDEMTTGAMQAMQAMSGMFESGSKDAQRLAIAMQALNLVQAVGAVLNQGNGDPYTAFGRMAAMASAVAALGISLDTAFGGDLGENNATDAQAAQGMNEWNEKASSIDDSVSLVASATDKLVGINTNMLSALQNLQSSLLAAAGVAVKGIETPQGIVSTYDFTSAIIDPLKNTGFSFLGDWVGNTIGGYLGGSSSVSDEGIRIIGGAMSELIDNITVQAFQEISYKKWRWGSTKTTTQYADVADDVSNQFLLVFNSLADAVYEGATMLGIGADAATDAINSFVLDTITISLKDMSVDEQAEALEDVFSEIFNDLTASVIPWLSDLQQTGEDLGTTLSRVATEVSIADLMVERFGVTFGDKMADPEAYATAIDNITNMIGTVDDLADSVSSFVDAFASDDEKLSILFDSLTSALNGVGLELPSTAAGMWDLMNGIDATTEAGQTQIATLLELTDTASSYYDMLNDQNEAMADLSDTFASAVMDIYDVSDGVAQISLDAALAAARLGDFSLAELLDVSDYALDTADFTSLADYNIAQAEAANKLLELSELSATQAGDVQTEQLDTLRAINDNIAASNEYLAALSAATSDNADAIERLAQA